MSGKKSALAVLVTMTSLIVGNPQPFVIFRGELLYRLLMNINRVSLRCTGDYQVVDANVRRKRRAIENGVSYVGSVQWFKTVIDFLSKRFVPFKSNS